MLSRQIIAKTRSDKVLFKLLGDELSRLVKVNPFKNLERWLKQVQKLPVGLRAMAATHGLDVSMCLDDLGWHFGNWPSLEVAEETRVGLGALGARKEQHVFAQAIEIARRNWAFITSDGFFDRYLESDMKGEMMPLNDRLWGLTSTSRNNNGTSLVDRWAPYARRYPETIFADS